MVHLGANGCSSRARLVVERVRLPELNTVEVMRWPEQHGDGSTRPFSKRPANAERKPEHGGSAILKNAGRYFSLRGTVKAIWLAQLVDQFRHRLTMD